jgi:peptidyl-tRNA hydrolase
MENDLRIAVVFRSDLDMPRGKSEVQFGHAISMLIHRDPDAFIDYLAGLQLKVSLEADDASALERIVEKAKARHVPAVTVVDAGRTIFGEPTLTCVGIGPMSKTDCNAITRGAKLRQ